MRKSKFAANFLASEKSGGILLLVVTIFSLIMSNSPLQHNYAAFWNAELAGHSLIHWINEGLMAIFFLLIGLELEREIYAGELSNMRSASLPIFAAIGGMVVPAVTYLIFNFQTPTQSGAGIPVATDIAFAVGVLSLLGNKVPFSLKIFLTALAVIDDLGAILVIAVFYSGGVDIINLMIALSVFGFLIILNKIKVYNLIPYLFGGTAMWYFMSNSGVHSTIAGVLLAFAIPFRREGQASPSFVLLHFLEKPAKFIILPLFALANTLITIDKDFIKEIFQPYSLGIIIGLFAGKPAGILLFSYLAVLIGLSERPANVKWSGIAGIGLLGGIGFTMSIFITILAFNDSHLINNAKAAILAGSLLAGSAGYLWLKIKADIRTG